LPSDKEVEEGGFFLREKSKIVLSGGCEIQQTNRAGDDGCAKQEIWFSWETIGNGK
jgi:hypothetical protein